MFLSAEEEESLTASFLSNSANKPSSTTTKNKKAQTAEMTIDEHMAELEKTFSETLGTKTNDEKQDELRKAYSDVHSPADNDLVERLRLAMKDIPDGTKVKKRCLHVVFLQE